MIKPGLAADSWVEYWFEYGVDIKARRVFIGANLSQREDQEVDLNMSEFVIKGLLLLDSMNTDPIDVIINCTGGDEYSGMGIYDAIQSCKSYVTAKVYGSAMSMGSIIFQAADERLISANSKIMIHYGTAIATGDMHDLDNERWALESKKFRKQMEDLYLKHIKEKHPQFPRDKLKEMLKFDTILTAQETIRLGLADGIIG